MLYDQITKRRGNLFIIDLLHPKFFAHTSSSIHYSFISLRDAIDTITMPNRRGKVPLEPHLLVNILAEFISGRSKSTVFTYINEYPQKDFDDVVAILDLVKSLTNIPCISLPNETNPRARRETEDMKNQTERLNKTIDDIQAKNTALSEKYSTFMNAFRHFKELKRTQMCQEDLVHKLNAGTIEDSIRRAKIELLKSEAIASIKDQQKQELEHEVKKLKLEIANNTKMIEEYEMTTKNHQEQLERCKEEIQRLRKAAMQSQKEISILHREHEAEKQKLIDNFKQKAAEFKEGVRRRFEEMQNS
ncbi:hypothetical protein G6F37_002797 [Rhizopus arrhizus]|nr:hypothetical protein G6F38_006006 [Rhizopus arrhizus]KAG1161748.1 hypothetical protein G6F37_002797 [Rhizopus arrhizus]